MTILLQVQKKYILYILFAAAFLLTGIIGHDPWKQDETYSFGIIYHFYTTHTWLVPVNAAEPFMEKPPLYYWTAAILCNLLSSLLPLHDAARIASFLYILVAVYFVRESSRVFFRNAPNNMDMISLALFLGTLGIVRHAHDMFTDVALLAGASITLYGMALLTCGNENWRKSGFWLGLGIGVAFLSKGLFTPAIFGISFMILFLALPALRRVNTLRALLIAAIIASLFLFIWPMLLYQHSPELFKEWFWDNNVGRFLGFSVAKLGADNKPGYILYSVLWFAFPVFPLALAALWKKKAGWRAPEYLLPAVISITGLVLLQFSATARALYLLPLIPAFTLLATQGLILLPERFLQYWNNGVRLLSVIAIVALWLVWWGLGENHPLPFILPYVSQILPVDFVPAHTQLREIMTALFAGLVCIMLQKPGVNPYRNAARIWFAGIATIWITAYALLLPWINETKSYRPILTEMNYFISQTPYSHDCMNEQHLGESIAPMLEYFSGIHTFNRIENFSGAQCPLILAVTNKAAPNNPDPAWHLIWKKSRDLDAKDEELRLYARNQ